MIFKLAHASKGKSASELLGAASSQNTCVLSPTGHFRNFWDFLGALTAMMFLRVSGCPAIAVVREGEQ